MYGVCAGERVGNGSLSLLGVAARLRLIELGAVLRGRLLFPIVYVVVVVVVCGCDVVVVKVISGVS